MKLDSTSTQKVIVDVGPGTLLFLLQLLFVGLKLSNQITWSWVLVLAPTWGNLAIIAVVLVLLLIRWMFSSLFFGSRRKT